MCSSALSLTSALDRGGWSTQRPGRFTPRKDSVLIVEEAGWAPGTVWTGAENLAPTGIRFTDRPARCESLYRLGHPSTTKSKKLSNYGKMGLTETVVGRTENIWRRYGLVVRTDDNRWTK